MSGEGWNTIESDAKIGVQGVQCEELVALDAEQLEHLSADQQQSQRVDGQHDPQAAEELFFAAQTIQNACGTQALLSILLNHEDRIDLGSELREFKDFTRVFPSQLRGEALSNSELIRGAHNSFARSTPFVTEESPSQDGGEAAYHFIAYSPINGILYELDGLQEAPISHGSCSFEEFSAKIIPVLQRRIEQYPSAEICFNLLALVQDLRVRAEEIGDTEALAQEESKRQAWRRENALRQHNFTGFLGEYLRQVVQSKLTQGGTAYEDWLATAVGHQRT